MKQNSTRQHQESSDNKDGNCNENNSNPKENNPREQNEEKQENNSTEETEPKLLPIVLKVNIVIFCMFKISI